MWRSPFSWLWLPIVLLTFKTKAESVTVLLVTGRKLATIGGNEGVYNLTREAVITTEARSVIPNGISHFWNQSDGTFQVGGEGQITQYRSLLRFEAAHQYIPVGAAVEAAELTLTFINWNAPTIVQACFLTRDWSTFETPGQRYTSTGWLYSRWNGSMSLPWTSPGGWVDCDSRVNVSFVVPASSRNGEWVMTIPLDPWLVGSLWLENGGRNNFGLMFRGMNGTVLKVVTSLWKNGTLYRPALAITYNTNKTAAPPAPTYPVNLTSVRRVWWVGLAGHDDWNSGHQALPLRSPARALTLALPGDSIYLMTGVYGASLSIYTPNLTIRSAPGNWAVLSAPVADPRASVNVITIFPGADYGTLRDLEITGGFYYGLMFFTSWNAWSNHSVDWAAPSHWRLKNLRIHDTGSSCIKMSVKAVNNTITNCEFYNTGVRLRTSGDGIVIVQGYDISITDSYFHDLPAAGVVLAGGSARVTIERNWVERAERGFELGSWTDTDLMDVSVNLGLNEALNNTVINNVLTGIRMGGVILRSARNTLVAHNTIWQAQEGGQAAVLLDNSYHELKNGGGNVPISCAGLTALVGNLVVLSPTAMRGPLVQIRGAGLDPDPTAAVLIMSYNVYYNQAGEGPKNGSFWWGTGAMLEDQRVGRLFVGNATGWSDHCSRVLGQAMCDVGSTEADPRLDGEWAPLDCSPARSRVPSTLNATLLQHLVAGNASASATFASLAVAMGLMYSDNGNGSSKPLVLDDFHGRPRPAGDGARDAGAVQSGVINSATAKPLPPVPPTFASFAAYRGIGLGPVFDKAWPYYFWQPRRCMDIIVDSIAGNDSQTFDYYSKYTQPFKTLAVALTRHSMCDIIFLRSHPGQHHVGGVTVKQTNLTIATYPGDLPARAVLNCMDTGSVPCLFVYGDATALNVTGIDIVMSGPNSTAAPASCIHMNEGAGSGSSPYWSFFTETSGRGGKGSQVSVFKDLNLINCGVHGIKLSTFVRGLVLEGINITDTSLAGVMVVGGSDITIRGCRISNVGESALRLGGGVRNVHVEANLIRNYGGVGIMLGSEGNLASYTDVDWSRMFPQDWHECINVTVVNNIVDTGSGAGVAFYSARDIAVNHNTFLNVAATMQAAVLLNISPKQIGPAQEVGPPNINITFRNNIVTMPAHTRLRFMVQTRILQGAVVTRLLNTVRPTGNCSANTTLAEMTAVPPLAPPAPPPSSPAPSDNLIRHRHQLSEEGEEGEEVAAAAFARLRGTVGQEWRGPGGAHVGMWDVAVTSSDTAADMEVDFGYSGGEDFTDGVTPAWYGREASAVATPSPVVASSVGALSQSELAAAALIKREPPLAVLPAAVSGDEDDNEGNLSSATAASAADDAAATAAITDSEASTFISAVTFEADGGSQRRRNLLVAASFTDPYVYDKRNQGRNSDGSCPFFPDSNPWHQDVSGLAVHPRSDAIKSNIGFQNLHLDFGFAVTYNGTTFPAGMPINFVNSSTGVPRLPIVFGPSGYGDPGELDPDGRAPIPADASVQGAFPGCGDPPCWGDRHLIVIDNATCTLYEAWRSFPPSVTGNGTWQVEAFLRFNLSRNALDHPLGATSADAAGLPIMPGLLRYEEVVRGEVDHALRFTGPNSRPAYAMPATHFAASGYMGRDSPYMGMRVRLKASYNCSQLARAAAVVCEGLKKYGAFFADNGLPWDFAGEGTSMWYPIWNELREVMNISSTQMEVINPGCICTNVACTIAECNGVSWVDPNAPPTYPSIVDPASTLHFANNIYYKPGNTEAGDTLFVDQRVPPLGAGYGGGFAGWGPYLGGGNEAGSVEADPQLDPVSYAPLRDSIARCKAPLVQGVVVDFYGRSRGGMCGTDVGAVRYTSV